MSQSSSKFGFFSPAPPLLCSAAQIASTEGKRGGEFYTPASIVRHRSELRTATDYLVAHPNAVKSTTVRDASPSRFAFHALCCTIPVIDHSTFLKRRFMKTVLLKETPTRYIIEVEQETLEQGPTLLQRDGEPVAVLVPLRDYQAFQDWQAAQRTSAIPVDPEFEAEVAAFERLKPELLKRHPGRAVAIHQGRVVEVGDDKMDVLQRVLRRLGDVRCYVEWVEPDTPRHVRIPTVWVAGQ